MRSELKFHHENLRDSIACDTFLRFLFSIRETIRNVIYSHRDTWSCFKIYDTFSSSQLPSNCHNPVIRFEYDEEPLEIFPTRGAYPVRTKDMEDYYNDWLNDLIYCECKLDE